MMVIVKLNRSKRMEIMTRDWKTNIDHIKTNTFEHGKKWKKRGNTRGPWKETYEQRWSRIFRKITCKTSQNPWKLLKICAKQRKIQNLNKTEKHRKIKQKNSAKNNP